MTKPLFRSRDLRDEKETMGIHILYEEQFMDAPTLAGGVKRLVRDETCYVVMDVGGGQIGARSIGVYESVINKEDTMVYYILNAFRPWSQKMGTHLEWVIPPVNGNPVGSIHIAPQTWNDGVRQNLYIRLEDLRNVPAELKAYVRYEHVVIVAGLGLGDALQSLQSGGKPAYKSICRSVGGRTWSGRHI